MRKLQEHTAVPAVIFGAVGWFAATHRGVGLGVPDSAVVSTDSHADWLTGQSSAWTRTYLRRVAAADCAVAIAAAVAAVGLRFGVKPSDKYIVLSLCLPMLWMIAIRVVGGYEMRFLGTGSDEFRKVLNAGVSLTAGLALLSYTFDDELSRVYLFISMPVTIMLDLLVRFVLRKQLHRARTDGRCMSTVVAVGHESAVAQLIKELRREPYHGLKVVAACLAGNASITAVEGVPVVGDLDDAATVVRRSGAATVAVLPSPEMDGVKLRTLAWELEKTGTDLYVAPALLDVAGPRTTIRPTAGLTLLHVDHPQLSGSRQVLKDLFDRTAAAIALVLLFPVMLAIAVAIRCSDGGPAFFIQTRVGKDGKPFKIFKFRTMVVDAEARFAELRAQNDNDGAKFKMRKDPRITSIGGALRKLSLDELPQVFNVLIGDMSLVGPRPPLPDEVTRYAAHVRRRLVVKPGITGLWQVSGRSDLTWDESVRLDLRYVENWSLALDLQILWKTISVMLRGSGAY
jgi:exopolysaccharide biosynthesis polyprenyl glycosylphosphotransferase